MKTLVIAAFSFLSALSIASASKIEKFGGVYDGTGYLNPPGREYIKEVILFRTSPQKEWGGFDISFDGMKLRLSFRDSNFELKLTDGDLLARANGKAVIRPGIIGFRSFRSLDSKFSCSGSFSKVGNTGKAKFRLVLVRYDTGYSKTIMLSLTPR